jgi:2-polyprenyl-3-methyl-5-hydroxy-6-metoxy-1,4-benzoquinol methylase
MFSGIRGLCKQFILDDLLRRAATEVTIADLGCGGADLGRWLVRSCGALGCRAQVYCIDFDPAVCEAASRACAGYGSMEIICKNAFYLADLPGRVDYVVSNHFLHHLRFDEIQDLLVLASAKARHNVLMVDLLRSRRALLAFYLLSGVVFREGYTAHDGLVSIARGFSLKELAGLSRAGGSAAMATTGTCGVLHGYIGFRKQTGAGS